MMQFLNSNILDSAQGQQQGQPLYRIPVATLFLCVALLVVFWLELKNEIVVHQRNRVDLQDLVAFGAASGQLVLSGDFFRLISANFLSDEIVPILINLPFLLVSGFFLERKVGPIYLTAIFFIGGLLGAAFSVFFGSHAMIHFGSIDAVTAILVANSILVKTNVLPPSQSKFKNRIWQQIGPRVALALPTVYFKMNPSLYAAGIIGGALAGAGCGFVLLYFKSQIAERTFWLKKLGLAVVGGSFAFSAYATYSIVTGFHDYGFVKYAAPIEAWSQLKTDAENGGNKFMTRYPLDPTGYALSAGYAFDKKDYKRSEDLAKTALSLKDSIDSPKLSSLKMLLVGELALSLDGQGKLDAAKAQAKMPCSTKEPIVKYLREEGLCG